MQLITHEDRRGRVWTFAIPCTRAQAKRVRIVLACVRRMGHSPAKFASLKALDDDDRNGEFYEDFERVLLEGLQTTYPAKLDTGAGPAIITPTPAAVPEEEAAGFWWENL